MVSPAVAIQFPQVLEHKAVTVDGTDILAQRPVFFKVTRRIDISLLSRWQRVGYEWFCRRLPAKWRIPPIVPLERGGFASFDSADAACTSPDDQLLVLPFGWAYKGDTIDLEVVCRPRDPQDARRYEQLKTRYRAYSLDRVMCAEFAEELEFYKAELERVNQQMGDFINLAERADRFNEKYERNL